ncbi:MAG: gephyrin-like molybdotransferase Glp [Eubacteriales bacterium]
MLIVKDLTATRQMLFELAESLPAVLEAESVDLADAPGRILAGPLLAPADVPAFNRSQVDGYAVRAADTFGASEAMPAILRLDGDVKMGQPADIPLIAGSCQAVPTGGQIPAGADAMIMIEDTDDFGDGSRYMNRSVSPGSHIIFRGDDIREGDLLLPAGTRLETRHLAAAAAAGLGQVSVIRLLRVAVISTGDELVNPGEPLTEGRIHDVNQVMLTVMITQAGAKPCNYGIIPDEFIQLQNVMKQAQSACDVIVISGGSSVGARDHVAAAIEATGLPGILQHGIAVKPGKPTLIGLCDGVPVIGLPGHPIAAWFMASQLLIPLLNRMQKRPDAKAITIEARLSRRIPSNTGREEFVLVQLTGSGSGGNPDNRGRSESDSVFAEPVFAKSGLITLLSRCQGYIQIPRDCEGLDEGTTVTVILMDFDSVKGVE